MQWNPECKAIQAAQLPKIFLVPFGHEFFLAGIVDADPVTGSRDSWQVGISQFGENLIMPRIGYYPHELGNLLNSIVDFAAKVPVDTDELLVARIKVLRLKRRLHDIQA